MNKNAILVSERKKNPLISVIVPIYNAEKYLDQCISSLYKQTYDNLEIICINDGSTDESVQILKQWEDKDSRIILVDKCNEGVSETRNRGLELATGEFVMFVDADDWIDAETCEKVIAIQQKTQADVVMWSYISEHKQQSVQKSVFDEKLMIFDDKEKLGKLHRRFFGLMGAELRWPEKVDSLGPVWGKLYKKELITTNKIEFVELKEIGTYEDGLFNIEFFGHVNSAVFVQEYFYHYRRTNEESVTSGYKDNLVFQWERLYHLMDNYIKENQLSDEFECVLKNRISLGILGLSINSVQNNNNLMQQWKEIKKILSREIYRESIKTLPLHYFPFHWAVFYGFAKMNCALGILSLVKVIKKIIN